MIEIRRATKVKKVKGQEPNVKQVPINKEKQVVVIYPRFVFHSSRECFPFRVEPSKQILGYMADTEI